MMTREKKAAWLTAEKLASELSMAADAEYVQGVCNIGGMKECRIVYMDGSWNGSIPNGEVVARFRARTWAELVNTLEQARSMLASLISRFYEE